MPRTLEPDRRSEAQRLRRVRGELDVTQRQLAALFGVANGAIAQWESGQRAIPGPALKLLELYEFEMGLSAERDERGAQIPFARGTRTARSAAASVLWLALFGAIPTGDVHPLLAQVREAALRRVTGMLSQLKGLAMKLGQIVSYADIILPERERELLETLQAELRPMPRAAVCQVFAQELGKTPRQLFAEWDPDPLATASIGQVHAARLADGRDVAVKVQYPRVVEALRIDLENVALIDRALSLFFRGQRNPVILEEISARILDECDYALEARNQRAMAAAFAGRPEIRIPAVIDELSCRRVLTSERVHGVSPGVFARTATAQERNRAAATILDFFFEGLLRHGMFNTDPTPGNFLLGPGQVCFLDYGRVKHYTPEFVSDVRRVIRALLERDPERLRVALIDLGAVPVPDRYDFGYSYRALLLLHRPMLCAGPFAITAEHLANVWRVLVEANPNRSRINLTRDLVTLHQFYFGVTALLVRLDVTVDFRDKFLALVYGPDEARPPPFTPAELQALEI